MATTTTPVILITGANQGIGYAIAEIFSQSKNPYTILIGARNPSRGSEAVSKLNDTKTNDKTTIETITIDLDSHDSIVSAVHEISDKFARLDVLVNNAARAYGDSGKDISREDWSQIFETNVIGTVDVTHSFLPLLKKSSDAKIVVVSTSLGSLALTEAWPRHPLTQNAMAYRVSKAAINMLIVEWTKNVDGVRIWGIDPGLCATEFVGDFSKLNGRDPREGADIVRQCVEGEREDAVGKVVFEEGGETGVRPW